MSVIAAETGDDNFRRIRLTVAIGVLNKQDIGRVRNPDAAMSDSDAAGDVQPVHEHAELVRLAVSISVFQNLHAVAARPRLLAEGTQRIQ